MTHTASSITRRNAVAALGAATVAIATPAGAEGGKLAALIAAERTAHKEARHWIDKRASADEAFKAWQKAEEWPPVEILGMSYHPVRDIEKICATLGICSRFGDLAGREQVRHITAQVEHACRAMKEAEDKLERKRAEFDIDRARPEGREGT